MDYSSFTREQLEKALTSVKIENVDLQNSITKLKKELKDLKGQCSSFEGDSLDRKTVARRFSVH
jgi:predicted  nucleic acid-binding Zn-ribbon protein